MQRSPNVENPLQVSWDKIYPLCCGTDIRLALYSTTFVVERKPARKIERGTCVPNYPADTCQEHIYLLFVKHFIIRDEVETEGRLLPCIQVLSRSRKDM